MVKYCITTYSPRSFFATSGFSNMKRRTTLFTGWGSGACWVFFAAMLCLPGCSTEDARLESLRERYLLSSEPPAPTTIAEAKAKLSENSRVKLVGRIPADEHEAFTRGEATFFVTEILSDDHGHSDPDHVDNCPFCQMRAANAPRAAVQFVDEQGEPLEVDARELFGIDTGDTVVIQGMARLIAKLDVFVVTADSIYLRASGDAL